MTAPEPLPLHGPEYKTDPYPLYRRLREEGPVHRVNFPSGVNAWLVTGYEAAHRALNDDRLGKNHDLGNSAWRERAAIMPEPQHSQLQVHLLHQDPPKHTVMRKMVAEAFLPRHVERLRGRFEEIAAELLDAAVGSPGTAEAGDSTGAGDSTEVGDSTGAAGRSAGAGDSTEAGDSAAGVIDVVGAFAAHFPFRVLCEVIGLPPELAARFDRDWGKVVQPVGPTDPQRPVYEGRLRGLQNYITEVVEDKRRNPGADLLTKLVRACANGEITKEEQDSIVFQLLVAGQEPVTNQITTALIALLRHPEQLRRLQRAVGGGPGADPDLLPRAVEELLRYDSAFELTTWRFFAEDADLLGTRIPAGDSVIVSLCAANRDPEGFPDADTLDLDRSPNPHLAFGHGVHFCPGAALARIELQIALRALLTRLPRVRLAVPDDRLVWVGAVLARGVNQLPVAYGPTGPSRTGCPVRH
ncbi:cytochrome P450 [Streptomyces sp. SAJ15]|uniref:cytochrome P450 family protein n=1 Tax=Streptomyces sp. SAJ15 TaxID=2011095 RepID=UPI0011860B69|nr:cytochrome P450 [Streptomyces sp. SAJ15]TVL94141.1 cytochrome P450 [Streptomyces sp. SAJ15]